MSTQTLQDLLDLSHFLGDEKRKLAILGEGNTSARVDNDTFLVKASGSCLETLGEDDLVACRFDALLPMLEENDLSDQASLFVLDLIYNVFHIDSLPCE